MSEGHIVSFDEALDDLTAGREPSGGVRLADVDPAEFPDHFATDGHLLEVDARAGRAYWHTPNTGGEIRPAEKSLTDTQVVTARKYAYERWGDQ